MSYDCLGVANWLRIERRMFLELTVVKQDVFIVQSKCVFALDIEITLGANIRVAWSQRLSCTEILSCWNCVLKYFLLSRMATDWCSWDGPKSFVKSTIISCGKSLQNECLLVMWVTYSPNVEISIRLISFQYSLIFFTD